VKYPFFVTGRETTRDKRGAFSHGL
jgi:hypothetical protein